jgi:hypothetical protein
MTAGIPPLGRMPIDRALASGAAVSARWWLEPYRFPANPMPVGFKIEYPNYIENLKETKPNGNHPEKDDYVILTP